jgi:uncharacterized membrane protein
MADGLRQTVTCHVCKQAKQRAEVLPAEMIRPAVAEVIRGEFPDWSSEAFICHNDLNRFRTQYVQHALEEERGELSSLEADVVRSLHEQELLSRDVNAEFERELTFGERVADKVASFGGSWTFMMIFGAVLLVWIAVNSFVLVRRPFDPYPFILLNLVLSCLAAIQAPVIMMSQNRHAAKDRLRAENDYRVNLKAELEIRHVNAKIDLLLTHQWQRLMEIQQIQMDLMEELVEKGSGKHDGQ